MITELIKRYVNEYREKINTIEDIAKVAAAYPIEYKKIEKENKLRKILWGQLPKSFRQNRGLNEYSTTELKQLIYQPGRPG